MNEAILHAETKVWEKVYAGQDITSSMRHLESLSAEAAKTIREEIAEYCFSFSN